MDRLARQLQFIVEVDRLKEILRRNVTTQSRRQENSAEHSWHLALCAIVLAEHAGDPKPEVDRVVRMLLVHDLVEIDAGDSFIYDAQATADQEAREQEAARRLFGMLPPDQAGEFQALWEEFEAARTPEARFAKAMDRLQPVLLNLSTAGGSWRRHGVTLEQVRRVNGKIAASSPVLWDWCEAELQKAVLRGDLARG
jgi:putative hydrolase of HD superfamily